MENIQADILFFFYDGTSRHMVYFDQLKKDEGYAAVIENSEAEMLSSHQVKRFFQGIFMDSRRSIQEDIEAAVYMAIKDREA